VPTPAAQHRSGPRSWPLAPGRRATAASELGTWSRVTSRAAVKILAGPCSVHSPDPDGPTH